MFCSICKKKYERGNGTFFSVPKEENRRGKWSAICQMNFKANALICADHFDPSHILRTGGRELLMPIAMPVLPSLDNEPFHNICQAPVLEKRVNIAATKDTKNILNKNSNMPNLQEDHKLTPVIKSSCCTGSTQTNKLFCGLVQVSAYLYEFHFNCFYCSEVFPLEKWQSFVDHLKENHFEIEEAFKYFKDVSDDHDYTDRILSQSNLVDSSSIESIVVKSEPQDLLEDPLETKYDSFESMPYDSPIAYYTSDENKTVFDNMSYLNTFIETDTPKISSVVSETKKKLGNSKKRSAIRRLKKINAKTKSKKTLNEIDLSECLKAEPKNDEEYESISIEIVQPTTSEITFEYTHHDIVDLLIDSMKNYPVLWQYDYEPFNEDFYEAVEDLCKIINDKWSLNIDNLKMRRSINRILRFYCYLFPNENVENIDQFTNFYDKCAAFLPSSVYEIAYARCSHCYMCYGKDFDLKRHLLEEQKYLQWPHQCEQCKECFREIEEYEFHKILPHYDEIFRCKSCGKRFELSRDYNRHISSYHPKERLEPGEYKCDVCPKTFQNKVYLRHHKITHGAKKYKCQLCSKSFCEKTRLKNHLKTHRKQYEFVCEVCGKGFITNSALSIHMATHTGAKVTCKICNLKLRQSSLGRHIKVVHMKKEFEESGTKPIREYNKVIKVKPIRPYKRKCEERKYHCKICKIYFENYKLIVEHNKKLHSDIPKWPCKMCTTEFSHSINLKRHYRKKHNLHAIQVFKLVHKNEDLNAVLNMKAELLDEITQRLLASRNKSDNVTKTNTSDEIFSEMEENHSSATEL